MNKTILTDVDGVLLNWFDPFKEWVKTNYSIDPINPGYHSISKLYNVTSDFGSYLVETFNSTNKFLNLSPYRDAVEIVRQMNNDGWKFIAITALGDDPEIRTNRERNLDEVFGEGIFKNIIYTSNKENKERALAPFASKSKYPWVENKTENAVVGNKLGLKSFIMDQDHNRKLKDPDIIRVNDWLDIHQHLTK